MFKKAFLIFGLFLTGCATTYNPATGRNELILIDTKSEVSLGESLSQEIRKEFEISNDIWLNRRLNNIGQGIALASDRQDLEYLFFVINDNELNAFAIPGGNIYVNSGLLNTANDDELAAVVSHEVGHVAARHAVKRLQAVLGYQIVMSIAFSSAGSIDTARAMDIVFNLIALGYSREDERLADRLAIKYTVKAGFNPRGMVSFLYKLEDDAEKHGRANPQAFLSSHPPVEERIKNMNQEIYQLEHPEKPKENLSAHENSLNIETASYASAPTLSPGQKSRKICPVCKNAYSSRYNFCPRDGARLIF